MPSCDRLLAIVSEGKMNLQDTACVFKSDKGENVLSWVMYERWLDEFASRLSKTHRVCGTNHRHLRYDR